MAATRQSSPKEIAAIRADHVDAACPRFPASHLLPLDGYTRWAGLKLIVPLSHETVRQRELKNRFPKRVLLGSKRCVGWKNSELLKWLADPAGYRASEAA